MKNFERAHWWHATNTLAWLPCTIPTTFILILLSFYPKSHNILAKGLFLQLCDVQVTSPRSGDAGHWDGTNNSNPDLSFTSFALLALLDMHRERKDNNHPLAHRFGHFTISADICVHKLKAAEHPCIPTNYFHCWLGVLIYSIKTDSQSKCCCV